MHRWLVAAALACGASAFAQQPIELPKVSETVDVVIVNLDVVVTDRDGRHVGGLTGSDFEVLEEGRPQPITNFSEIVAQPAAGAVVSENPPRAIVVFIDTLSLDFFHRKRVLTQLGEFFRRTVRPGDEAMIVNLNQNLTVTVPPTDDVARLEAGVARIMREPSANALRDSVSVAPSPMFGPGAMPAAQGLPRTGFIAGPITSDRDRLMSARFLVQQKIFETRKTIAAIRSVLSRMSGVSGRKALVVVSEGLDMAPGRGVLEATIGIEGTAIADGLFADEDGEAREGVASIAQSANAAGVAIYGIHPAGPGQAIDVTDSSPSASLIRQTAESRSIMSLTMLSERTGGAVTARTNGFVRAFDRIASDLSTYYSLGYRTKSSRKGDERNIAVRTRDRSLLVRSRRGFVDRAPEAEAREKVVANLFFGSGRGAMRIAGRAGKPQRVRGGAKVPVEIDIPMTALTFLPVGSQYAGGFHVYLAAADSRDNMSNVVQQNHRLSFAAADLPKTAGTHYTYAFEVVATPGSRLSIAVVDELSYATGFTRLEVPR